MTHPAHSVDGSCCQAHDAQRRGFLKLALVSAAAFSAGAVLPQVPAAAAGTADALLLSCMDYRLVDDIVTYMNARGMVNQYDHVVLAGASLGATSDALKWGQTFWDHLDVAIKLHHIKKVIVLDHLDCGAYRVVFGKDFKGDEELAIHREQLAKLKAAVTAKFPELMVETLIMKLDGSVMAG
jgi:carbonic anhydrase